MSGAVWATARLQHSLVRHDQLRAFGYGSEAIRHRISRGRLHPVRPGVYAVGRPEISRLGEWLAAVFACGPGAVLSHGSAAALWRITNRGCDQIAVTIPSPADRRPTGIRVHRAAIAPEEIRNHRDIPLTSPIRTLIDIASRLSAAQLEAAVNEADKRDLVDPEALREACERSPGRRGVGRLKRLLDRHTFRLTDSELERRFLPIASRAGLPPPLTQHPLNGYRVDFYFPTLGLVVETDGLRYHRTPAQQTRDARRDQAHAATGLERLRFTHFQIRYEPRYVEVMLRRVAARRLGILEV